MAEEEKKLEHEYEYDEEGNLVKARLNKEKLFRDKWDEVVEVKFYNKRHVQRISLAIMKYLGEEFKDWRTYAFGHGDAISILESNLEAEHPDDIIDQRILIGCKDNGKNDIEGFRKKLKRIALRQLSQ